MKAPRPHRVTPTALALLMVATALSPIAIAQEAPGSQQAPEAPTELATDAPAQPRGEPTASPPENSPASNGDAHAALQEARNASGVYFEKNMGQWDSRALFRVHAGGFDAFLTRDGLAMVQTQGPNRTATERHGRERTENTSSEPVKHWATFMRLDGSNPHAAIATDEESTYHTNYLVGNDSAAWHSNVPTYRRITFTDIYSGIDLVYHTGQDGGLKYDFIVHPGADPDRIKQHYMGHSRLNRTQDGGLSIETGLGTIQQGTPLTHQADGTPIPNTYDVQAGGQVSFAIGSYNASQDLIIDPLVYSTYLGVTRCSDGQGIAVDASGNAYVTGCESPTSYPTTSGAYQTSNPGGTNAFVTKLNAAGSSLVYSTYLGGSGTDYGGDIAVDSTGNAYVTGATWSTNYPVTSGAYRTTYAGGGDAFVTKLNAAGSALVYSTYLGGISSDYGYGIAVDANSNAYVMGLTSSTNYPVTSGAYKTTYAGAGDAFVTKLNAAGSALVYSTYLGGTNTEGGILVYPNGGIAIDSSGNAYVTGVTSSTNYPTTSGAYRTSSAGGRDVFVTKLNTAGSALVYSTYLGGTSDDYGFGIAVDASGNVYVTGYTLSTNYPTTSGAYRTSSAGSNDVYVTKLNAAGSALVYSTYLGGSLADWAYSIAVDASGNAYVTGSEWSTNFPTTSGAYQTSNAGSFDSFVTKLNAAGSAPVYSTYLGGNDDESGYGIAVDASGNAYVVGLTDSTNYPTTSGAYQTSNTGWGEAFVSVLPWDLQPPVASGVPRAFSWIGSLPSLSGVSWQDTESGLAASVQYSIGTTSGGTQISGWTNLPVQPTSGQTTSWTPTWTPPSLTAGMNYINVRVWDRLGNLVSSNGAYTVQYDAAMPVASECSMATIRINDSGLVALFNGNPMPTGSYRASYINGAMHRGSGINVNYYAQYPDSESSGAYVVDSSGNAYNKLPGVYTYAFTQAAAEAANAGRQNDFNWPGGAMYFQFLDTYATSNLPGNPNPTWQICHANSANLPLLQAWSNANPTLKGVCVQDSVSGLSTPAAYTVGSTPSGTDYLASTSMPVQPTVGQTSLWCPNFQVASSSLRQGSNYVSLHVADRAGNILHPQAYRIRYDNVADAVTGLVAKTGPGGSVILDSMWQRVNTVRFEWTATTSTSPVVGYSYTLSTNPADVPDSVVDTTNTYLDPTSSPLADGAWYFRVQAIDTAGNIGSMATYHINIDTTSPTLPIITSLTHPLQTAYYALTNATLSWSATDATSGIAGYYYRPPTFNVCPTSLTSGAWTTGTFASFAGLGPFGGYKFCVQAKDITGNLGPVATNNINVNTLPPTIKSVTPKDGSSSVSTNQVILVRYNDYKNGWDRDGATRINARSVQLFADGIDVLAKYRNAAECQPDAITKDVPASCPIQVDTEHAQYIPSAPWDLGEHHLSIRISDTTIPPVTASLNWTFTQRSPTELPCGLPPHLGGQAESVSLPEITPRCFTDEFPVPTSLREIESVVFDPANLTADPIHEQDGVPTILQSVWLPSQARNHTTNQDALQLLDGLPNGGLAVLVEPGHHEAWMVVADLKNQTETLLSNVPPVTGARALDQIEALQGIQARNALATVLTAGMQVHVQSVPPDLPTIVGLNWSDGALAADGSWLLIHTDPTRSIQLILAGATLPVTPASLSHFSILTDWRWQFLNLHSGDNFCYDPATSIQVTAATCKGNAWPGWVRAFSGQAAYALEAARAGLAGGQLPLTTTPPPLPLASVLTSAGCQPVRVGVAPGQLAAVCGDALPNPVCLHYQSLNGVNPCTGPPPCDATLGLNGDVTVCGRLEVGPCGPGQAGVVANNGSACAPLPALCPVPSVGAAVEAEPDCHSAYPCKTGFGIRVDDTTECPMQTKNNPDGTTSVYVDLNGNGQPDAGEPSATTPSLCPSPGIGVSPDCHTVLCPSGQVGVQVDGTGVCQPPPVACRLPTYVGVQPVCLPTHLQCIGVGLPSLCSILPSRNSASPSSSAASAPLAPSQAQATPFGAEVESPSNSQATLPSQTASEPESGSASSPPLPAVPHVKLPLIPKDSKWQLLGNGSYGFQTGIGIDYLLDPTGDVSTGNLVQQVTDASLTSPTVVPSALQRLFKFEGAYYKTPASPRDLVSIRLGIQNMDGIDKAQTFAIDGKRLHELLDVQPGETLNVTIDEEHQEGFQYAVKDFNNDGVLDLVVYIPHFSGTWLDIHNNANYADWQQVHMTSPTTGWLTGAYGAIYRYSSGSLTRYNVTRPSGNIDPDQQTMGLFVISDNDFYVTSRYWKCRSNAGLDLDQYIAHYQQGAFTLMPLPTHPNGCNLSSIWMKNDQNGNPILGYAGGAFGVWLKYTSANGWVSQNKPSNCSIQAIDFDSNGDGYIGIAKDIIYAPDACTSNNILRHSNGVFSSASQDSAKHVFDLHGTWAAGTSIYKREGLAYAQVSEPNMASATFMGIDQAGNGDSLWFAGAHCNSQSCSAALSNRNAGTWALEPLDSRIPPLQDVSFSGSSMALAVGTSNAVLQYREESPTAEGGVSSPQQPPSDYQPPPPQYSPEAYATVTAFGDTNTVITADGSGSYSNNGNSLTHYWTWGDATGTFTGQTVSHRYNHPGTYIVEHWVRDNGNGLSSEHQRFGVAIVSEPFSVGASVSNSVTNSASPQSHHYNIPAMAGDRYVQLSLSCPQHTVNVYANLNAVVIAPGNWPAGGWPKCVPGNNAVVAARIPSGQFLDIMVQSPQDGYTGSIPYTLTSSVVAPPSAWGLNIDPPTVYQNPLGVVTTGTTQSRATYATINWGDGGATTRVPAAGYANAGASGAGYTATHSYTNPGTYTVSINTFDDLGQPSASSTSYQTKVHFIPAGTAGVTNILATQAELTGTVTSLGGANSVTATYRLFDGPTSSFPQLASNQQVTTQTGALSNFLVNGLTAGTTYAYTLTLVNDVPGQRILSGTFQTLPDLTIRPKTVNDPGTATLGAAYAPQLQAETSHPNQVAHYVRWDTGMTEQRIPADAGNPPTTWTDPNTPYSVANTYAFAGTHTVEAHIQDTTLGRGPDKSWTTTVTGNAPISAFWYTSDPTTVTLKATIGPLGRSCASVDATLTFTLRLPGANNPTFTSPALSNACTSQTLTWQSPALDSSQTYQASLTLKAANGETWTTPTANLLNVFTNRAPTLGASNPPPAKANYLDHVRFTVLYQDPEADPPRNAANTPTPPQLTINGVTYTLYATASGTPDYRNAEYYYNVPSSALQQGQPNTPVFKVHDSFGRLATYTGPPVFVQAQSLVNLDFSSDAVGSVPVGMNLGGEPLNYWHVADAQAADMPGRLALGHHGKALWFANPNRGTTQDPSGGTPQGSILLAPMDLRQIMQPTLSFSSYFETRTGPRDLKTVEIRTQDASGAWSLFHTIKTIGYDGTGYGAWRSQHVALDAYTQNIVQVRFVYNSVTPPQEGYMGWLIDDVSLGHDHDLDELPDALENKRQDILIANQVIPVHVQPGSSGTSYVRRLIRPLADSFQLEALISNPNPSNLKVWVGVAATTQGTAPDSNEHLYLLYNNGVDQSGCTTTMSNGIQTGTRAAVINRGDGLDIKLDLIKCNSLSNAIPRSVFSQARDWFIQVQAPASGATWIESLSIVTSGKTDMTQFDTNHDTVSDGDKIDKLHDPLGYDADQDGIPNAIDPKDTIPSWAPAIQFRSTDYSNSMRLILEDLAATINGIAVDAEFDSPQQTRPLSVTALQSTDWSVNPGQYGGSLPNAVIVRWTDVYGTTGTVRVPMTTMEGHYGPAGIDWEAIDAATHKQVSFSEAFVDSAMMAAPLYIITAPLEGVSAPVITTGVALRTIAMVAAGAIAIWAAEEIHQQAMADMQAELNREAGQTWANGISYPVAGFGALSASEIEYLIQNGQRVTAPDGSTRIILQIGNLIQVLVVLGHEAQDGFEYVLDQTGNTVGNFLNQQRLLALALYGTVLAEAYMNELISRTPKPSLCDTPDSISLSTIDRINGISGVDFAFPLPPCTIKTLRPFYDSIDSVDAYKKYKQFFDNVAAATLFDDSYTKWARNDRSPVKANWFWDEGSSSVTVCPATGTAPDKNVRRCNDHAVVGDFGSLAVLDHIIKVKPTGASYSVDFNIDILKEKWSNAGTQLHLDGLTGSGYTVEDIKDILNGKEPIDFVVAQTDLLGTAAAADADIQVNYVLGSLTGGSQDSFNAVVILDQ